jgi:outer membrane protein OmpA-like peptidoglycan-associated protein/YHS domain-containing protein
MIRIVLLSISFSFLLISSSYGQQLSTQNKKAIKLYQQADIAIHARDFDAGSKLLKEAIEKDTSFIEAYARLGSLYKSIGDHENAKPYIFKLVRMKPNAKEFVMFYQAAGEYYLKEGDYDNAQKYYQMVVSLNPDKKMLLEDAKRNVEQCSIAIEIKKHPVSFKPVPLSDTINKFYLNAYPVLTADQNTLIYYKTDGSGANYTGDIMVTNRVNGKWSIPASISTKINTPLDEGTPTMSADGKILVFTACNRPGSLGACDLYISYRNGNDWTDPINLGPNVNSTGWDSEPSLSADGKTIYFSSERKGGVGMSDIWMSQQNEKGEWQPAINVGKPINTPGREVSPFIHADGKTLYFCSSYHPGLGQFDIFFSSLQNGQWSDPKNLGYPINTHLNEATVYITPDNKKGLYVMYEKVGMKLGRCKLYQFEVPKEIVSETGSTYAKGNVFDSETKQKLEAKIELIDLKTNKVIQSVKSDQINGDYLVVLTEGREYALYVQKEGYLFKSIFFNFINPKEFNPLTLDVFLDPIKSGKAIVLNNIFFPSNSYQLEDKSKTELDKIVLFLQNNPKISIEFGGHTDDVGSDKDNLDLSQKRAKSVYDYMIGKGIAASRLKYHGYGETKPMVPNTTEENRQMNRRIEFKVL